MIVEELKPNFDSCYGSVINNDECNEFYNRVNKKAKELNCKVAYNFCRSAYWIGNEECYTDDVQNQNFDDSIQIFNYSTTDGSAYYTIVVKYVKGYLGKDSYDREVYEDLNGDPFIFKVNLGSGYSLGSIYLKKPCMVFKALPNDYTYNDEDLKCLNFLKGFKDTCNYQLGYIAHYLEKGFELVEYENSTYWGSFEDNKNVSVFQRFDREYSTGQGNRAGHCHVYILQKPTEEKGVYVNEMGVKFKVHRTSGSVAYFGTLNFEIVKE